MFLQGQQSVSIDRQLHPVHNRTQSPPSVFVQNFIHFFCWGGGGWGEGMLSHVPRHINGIEESAWNEASQSHNKIPGVYPQKM
jgi:hypothetical protein